MPRKKANIHYIYKTTCLVTGRYYIGMHSTANLEDGYMGSGKRLRYSLRKHGVENHVKEILEFFDTREMLVEAEKIAITPKMIQDKMCMNLKKGGDGGFVNEAHRKKFIKSASLGGKRFAEKLKTDNNFRIIHNEIILRNLVNAHKNNKIKYNNFFGLTHTEKTKKIIGEKSKINQKGNKNSQYGTCWITNGKKNKKLKKNEIILDGWYFGRTIK